MSEPLRSFLEKNNVHLSPSLEMRVDALYRQARNAQDRDDYYAADKCTAAVMELLYSAGALKHLFRPSSA